jgi:hypothetical protein
VTHVVLDDHLLRDLLADDVGRSLAALIDANEVATTNLFYVRPCKSAASARGGRLTGGWTPQRRRDLARALVEVPDSIMIVPLRVLAFRIAELSAEPPVSTLGAEAVAAAEHLGGQLCVWKGDDGPHIRACARATGVPYKTVTR